MTDNKAIMKEICLRIIDESELERTPRFINRITFFYDYVINTCLEDKPELVMACIDEICEFEKKWYESNLHSLSLFEDCSIINCVSLFSVISYQLALDKFNGNEYQLINVFLENLFNGFFEAVREQANFAEMLTEEISDIGLNFLYASGHSNTMSLALYNYLMKVDTRGE